MLNPCESWIKFSHMLPLSIFEEKRCQMKALSSRRQQNQPSRKKIILLHDAALMQQNKFVAFACLLPGRKDIHDG